MTRDETREFAKAHDVIYLYHNRIDEIGDNRDSEERVFAAAEETLDELVDLVKKLQSNANAYNFLLTADHGFIYQNNELDESDFLGVEPHGETSHSAPIDVLSSGGSCNHNPASRRLLRRRSGLTAILIFNSPSQSTGFGKRDQAVAMSMAGSPFRKSSSRWSGSTRSVPATSAVLKSPLFAASIR